MCMKKLTIIAVLAVGVLLLLRPETVSAAVREGLGLCARTVIPSLFPFFVVTSLLLALGLADGLQGIFAPFMGPLFHLRGACALPLIPGLVGGYPSGARTAAELYRQGQISRQEAEVLLGFCDNCGPAFLLGYVGAGVLGSTRAGVWIFLIHVLSALLTGFVLCRLARDRGPALLGSRLPVKPTPFSQSLTGAVSAALTSTLQICAFVVAFGVLSAMLPAWIPPAASGVLEMVSGVSALSPGQTGFILAAAIVGWGGLSVHCQALSVAGPEGLNLRWHWAGKAVQAAVSTLLALLISGYVYP